MVTDPAGGWTDRSGVDLEEEEGAASAVTRVVRRRQPHEDPEKDVSGRESSLCRGPEAWLPRVHRKPRQEGWELPEERLGPEGAGLSSCGDWHSGAPFPRTGRQEVTASTAHSSPTSTG